LEREGRQSVAASERPSVGALGACEREASFSFGWDSAHLRRRHNYMFV